MSLFDVRLTRTVDIFSVSKRRLQRSVVVTDINTTVSYEHVYSPQRQTVQAKNGNNNNNNNSSSSSNEKDNTHKVIIKLKSD